VDQAEKNKGLRVRACFGGVAECQRQGDPQQQNDSGAGMPKLAAQIKPCQQRGNAEQYGNKAGGNNREAQQADCEVLEEIPERRLTRHVAGKVEQVPSGEVAGADQLENLIGPKRPERAQRASRVALPITGWARI